MAGRTGGIWWATWPGALALGLLSLAMVAVTAVPLVGAALLPAAGVSGTDVTASPGPGMGWRLTWAALAVVSLVVPMSVVWTARRRWMGWLLVALATSAAVLSVGLATLGVI